jgi:hypothetical protein
VSNEIEVIDIDSVGDFVTRIRQFEQRHIAQWFFRGHSDNSFKLVPSLFRLSLEETFATWDELEKYMMDAFKRESTPFLEHAPADEMEWLALAQHHGLPTCLLDWTSNPLIALYFAVEFGPEIDADVWCLGFPSTNNCLPESTHFAQRLTLSRVSRIYFPRHIFARTTNQSGCFTVHSSATPLDQANDFLLNIFIRFRIAASNKAAIINELFTLGIHRGFIYPGLEGIAKQLQFEVTARHVRQTTEPQIFQKFEAAMASIGNRAVAGRLGAKAPAPEGVG